MKRCITGIPLFLLLIALSSRLSAQNEFSKWHFGLSSALDFMTNPPIQTVGSMSTTEGCASMADATGNLLFYTSGTTVWNQQNAVMPNGTGLFGNISTSQSALIVKQPGSNTLYYIFTQDAQVGVNGLCYSVVDMSLAAGMGSVTVKNVPLSTPCTEQLGGVPHCNGTDIWVTVHQMNSSNFLSYLVTASGINPSPVISAAGNPISNSIGQGIIKFSPDGNRLGMTAERGLGYMPNWVELYDFDPSSGIVSNPFVLTGGVTSNTNLAQGYYSCEFSADGTKFYASNPYNAVICQWDLCAGSPAAIISSSLSLSTGTDSPSGLQRAINGKIYCVTDNQKLSVIQNPNIGGTGCNLSVNSLTLSGSSVIIGLPNFVGTLKEYTLNAQVSCHFVSFSASAPSSFSISCLFNPPGTTYLWNFGEPASGAANSSTLVYPAHTYSTAGTYTVKLVRTATCRSDTLFRVITISPLPTLAVSGTSLICKGQNASFTVSGANTYSWSNGITTTTSVFTPTVSGLYNVTGTSSVSGCSSNKTFSITVAPCTAMEQLNQATEIKISPNPFSSHVFIELPGAAEIFIYNQLGDLVYTTFMQPGKQDLDLSTLNTGLFFASIRTEQRSRTVKLVKTN